MEDAITNTSRDRTALGLHRGVFRWHIFPLKAQVTTFLYTSNNTHFKFFFSNSVEKKVSKKEAAENGMKDFCPFSCYIGYSIIISIDLIV